MVVTGRQQVAVLNGIIQQQHLRFSHVAFKVRITGKLIKTNLLADNPLVSDASISIDPSGYILVVDRDQDDQHEIVATRLEKQPMYSGYIWKCLADARVLCERHNLASIDDWTPSKYPPRVDDLYFIWEHTNFTCPEAIGFSAQCLDFKESLVRDRYESLKQIWKSSRFLRERIILFIPLVGCTKRAEPQLPAWPGS